VADFKSKLHHLSVRGTPVGAEELIERIEAELAGDSLVVATRRREGAFMTKTDQAVTTKGPGPGRGLAWGLAAFAVVLAVGGLYFAFSGSDGQVVDQTTVPTPTTVLTTVPITPTLLPGPGQEPVGMDPGLYFVDADGDPSTPAGGTFVIEGPGWIGSSEGANRGEYGGAYGVMLHVNQIDEPYTPGCEGSGGKPMAAGSTAVDLADGYAASGFTVREAPAPVSAFGQDGFHVVVEVQCFGFGGGHSNLLVNSGDVMETWIFDMNGHIVKVEAMIQAWHETSPEDLAGLRAVIDSLVLTP
jgi:hypothetical protein